MAKAVLRNPYITVNGVDVSAWVSQVALDETYDLEDVSTLGDAVYSHAAGVGVHTITIDFIQDFANSALEQTVNSVGASLVGTVVPIIVKPTSAAAGATNPKYSMNALVHEWQPLRGAVGGLSTVTAQWLVNAPGVTVAYS